MIDTLSQGLVALSTWVWLEVHAMPIVAVLAVLIAAALLAVVAAALLGTMLRRWAAASLPAAVREPVFVLKIPRPGPRRPVGGRGPRAPGAARRRLA